MSRDKQFSRTMPFDVPCAPAVGLSLGSQRTEHRLLVGKSQVRQSGNIYSLLFHRP